MRSAQERERIATELDGEGAAILSQVNHLTLKRSTCFDCLDNLSQSRMVVRVDESVARER